MGKAPILPCPWSSSGVGDLCPRYDLPFAFTRVKAFSGVPQPCSQPLQEAGALSGNRPSNISQRFYAVGPGGLFRASPGLHLYSINVEAQHGIKCPLCCFMKGLEHVYKQLCITPVHQAETPRVPAHAPAALPLAKPLGAVAATSAGTAGRCPPGTLQGARQPSPPEASAQPSSSATSFAPAAGPVCHFAQFMAFSGRAARTSPLSQRRQRCGNAAPSSPTAFCPREAEPKEETPASAGAAKRFL